MPRLNAQFVQTIQPQTQSLLELPEKVIQFGEGNFLRGFTDWMLHELNKQGLFNGRAVLVQPRGHFVSPKDEGKAKQINDQDGLYTLLLRGLEHGEKVVKKDIILSVSRCLNPYTDWQEVEDKLLVAGELFHFWAIEGRKDIEQRLPFAQVGLNVIWTDDLTPYRIQKVRILNGAHTASCAVAFLYGLDTVGEMMDDHVLGRFVRETIYNEIIPSILEVDSETLIKFADAVVERFKNPYIKHYLTSIMLNSTSKFKARNLPSIKGYYQKFGVYPMKLTFAFASLLSLYRNGKLEGSSLQVSRTKGDFTLIDNLQALIFLSEVWSKYTVTEGSAIVLAQNILANDEIWGQDLNCLLGFAEEVGQYLYLITREGLESAITLTLK